VDIDVPAARRYRGAMREPLVRTRRWTRQEYGRLIDLGFFGEDRKDNKVELLDALLP